MKLLSVGCVLATLAAFGNLPPQGVKPLSEVLKTVEAGGLQAVTEATFDDGVWEIEGLRNDRPVEVDVDPMTGKTLRERADTTQRRLPDGAKLLSEICRRVEDAGYTSLSEAELELAGWEIEALRNGVPRQLTVDVRTGEIVADRAD